MFMFAGDCYYYQAGWSYSVHTRNYNVRHGNVFDLFHSALVPPIAPLPFLLVADVLATRSTTHWLYPQSYTVISFAYAVYN